MNFPQFQHLLTVTRVLVRNSDYSFSILLSSNKIHQPLYYFSFFFQFNVVNQSFVMLINSNCQSSFRQILFMYILPKMFRKVCCNFCIFFILIINFFIFIIWFRKIKVINQINDDYPNQSQDKDHSSSQTFPCQFKIF